MKKRVLCPLAPGFEELEAIAIIDLLRRAGDQVITASVGTANPVIGKHRVRVMADIDLAEALAEWGDDGFDLVVLPGGPGVATLSESEPLRALLAARIASGRLVAAICAAPTLLAAALREGRASFVINAAGYTGKPNVDACELHKTDCLQGNAVLPGLIAQACEQAGVPWGHVSSGCIFTGARALRESNAAMPMGSGACDLPPKPPPISME
jgi:putative intracellular protease/amidase